MSVSRLRSSKELKPLVDRCYTHWQPKLSGKPPAGRASPELVRPPAPAELDFLRAGSRDVHSLSDGARAASTTAKAWSGLGGYLSTAQAAAATATTSAFRPSALGASSRDSHLSPLLISALRLFRVRQLCRASFWRQAVQAVCGLHVEMDEVCGWGITARPDSGLWRPLAILWT